MDAKQQRLPGDKPPMGSLPGEVQLTAEKTEFVLQFPTETLRAIVAKADALGLSTVPMRIVAFPQADCTEYRSHNRIALSSALESAKLEIDESKLMSEPPTTPSLPLS